jgi:hypothetical protein
MTTARRERHLGSLYRDVACSIPVEESCTLICNLASRRSGGARSAPDPFPRQDLTAAPPMFLLEPFKWPAVPVAGHYAVVYLDRYCRPLGGPRFSSGIDQADPRNTY